MLAAILIALALPLAAMINFIVGAAQARKTVENVEIAPEATAALQKSLEDAAEKSLPAAVLMEEAIVEVRSENIPDEGTRITTLAESLGGSATSLGEDKIWAQIPESRVEAFKALCRNPQGGKPASQPATREPLILVEVLIKPATP